MNLKQLYNDFTIKHMNHYIEYQAAESGLSNDAVVEYFWFTIKPLEPSGSWEKFQFELEKTVQNFHKSVCMNIIGKYYDRKKNKHLKPFIYAAPDFESSNYANPQYKNEFNHIHGLIALQGEQLNLFKKLLKKNGDYYHYGISVGNIRNITIGKIDPTQGNLSGYINYINKNTNRQSFDINPSMMIPKGNPPFN